MQHSYLPVVVNEDGCNKISVCAFLFLLLLIFGRIYILLFFVFPLISYYMLWSKMKKEITWI